MLSKFFLDRPVFAWVVAIIIMLLGCLAINSLPISQYPPIAPPSIAISANYTGGSAETVENSVTQIIEQKMTGFDNLIYQTATSDSSGAGRLELTFTPGTDPDMAWSQVQNKLQLALTSLPEDVQAKGVNVRKSTKNYLMFVGLISEDGSMDEVDLKDYAKSTLENVIARVKGVGEVDVFGGEYAMRIWIDVEKLYEYNLVMSDVVSALRSYNVEVSAGQFGSNPAPKGQRLNAVIMVQSLLKTPAEFASIPVRSNPDGSVVRISDIGRAELGTANYNITGTYNGKPEAGMAIRQAAGANALETSKRVRAKLEELAYFFPPGMKVVYPYDSTLFIGVAINEVVHTLIEAIVLVFLVMYLFMGNFRATIIPTIAVPVVVLGTYAVLSMLGYSINMLTMFAMVLAIGLLVDDAIVVVENVERLMTTEGLSPRLAAAKSMDEITSALIGIGLVLSAVFGPMAFFEGSTGVIYRQFSVTIISAMALSVLVALILTPVLCATFLKVESKEELAKKKGFSPFRSFFKLFEFCFNKVRDWYVSLVGHALAKKTRYVILFLLITAGLVHLFAKMPTGYLPDEDQGVIMLMATLPPGSTLQQTEKVMEKVTKYFYDIESEVVESAMAIRGVGFAGTGQNVGMAFIKLKDWSLRKDASKKADAISKKAMELFVTMREAQIYAFSPPSVPELGQATGFDFELLDPAGLGHAKLIEARNALLAKVAQSPVLQKVRPNGLEDIPEYRLDVDWDKAGALGVPLSSIHNTVAASIGSAYVNDFIQGGRVKRVYVQAESKDRMQTEDINKLYVRNNAGKMVPMSALATGRWTFGSPKLERYNGFPSINIIGEPAPGYSSGEAMAEMERLVRELPYNVGYEWTGLSYQERQASSQMGLLYAFSILVIFLCLAALYESWPIPISIMLTLPLGAIGGVIASSWVGHPNDVYFQIGMLTTLGLTTKNAILIVQFAKLRVEQMGMDVISATIEASKLRFRPIIMTSLAFGFGVLPLAIASGAGSAAQNAIGVAVLGGVVTSTLLVTIFAPLFYVIIQKTFGKKKLVSITELQKEAAITTKK